MLNDLFIDVFIYLFIYLYEYKLKCIRYDGIWDVITPLEEGWGVDSLIDIPYIVYSYLFVYVVAFYMLNNIYIYIRAHIRIDIWGMSKVLVGNGV